MSVAEPEIYSDKLQNQIPVDYEDAPEFHELTSSQQEKDVCSAYQEEPMPSIILDTRDTFGKRFPKGRNSSSNIQLLLDRLPILSEVRCRASDIANILNRSTKRGSKLNQLIFISIYYAHLELGISCDVKHLAQLVGIKQTDISKARALYSEVQTGYSPPQKKTTACDLVPKYCEYLRLTPDIVEMFIIFANTVLGKRPEMNERFPQNVAAGIVLYFATLNGIIVDKKQYAEAIKLSEVTIQNMCKEIEKIHLDQ